MVAWEAHGPSLQRHLTRMEATRDAVLATDTLAAGETLRCCSGPDLARMLIPTRRSCPDGRPAAPDIEPWALLAP